MIDGTKARLFRVVLFHAIFAAFSDIEASVMNFLAVPVRNFFRRSLQRRYGVQPASEQFELLYSMIASSFFVGIFVGGLAMGYCMERFGRKGTAIYIRSTLGILSAAAMLIAKWLDMVEFFAVGHFLAGTVCTLKVVLLIYLAECAPDRSRGLCATAVGSGSTLLCLLITPLCLPVVFGNDRDWWLVPAICLLLAMTHLFVAGNFPESPKHLFIGQGEKEQAKCAIRFYHGSAANIAEIFEEFESERRVVHRERVEWRTFWDSHRLRWSLAIAVLAAFVPALSLINLKSQYLESMLMRYGLDQSAAVIATLVMTALGAPLSVWAPFLVESKGRRPLFLAITALSCLELALVMGAQALFDVFGAGWLVAGIALAGCTLGQASCSLGILHMNPILVGELFPHAARTKATQISMLLPMLFVLAIVFAYPPAIASVGALFFMPLLVLSALLLLFMWKWLPETKGRPVDDIFRKLAESRTPSVANYGAVIGGTGSNGNNGGEMMAEAGKVEETKKLLMMPMA